jgi:CMP-N,N'-diacetyllegionaminic acid synthase
MIIETFKAIPVKKSHYSRRQGCPVVYEFNGAIYIISASDFFEKSFEKLKKVKKYIMDKRTSVDIDDAVDFCLAEILIKSR